MSRKYTFGGGETNTFVFNIGCLTPVRLYMPTKKSTVIVKGTKPRFIKPNGGIGENRPAKLPSARRSPLQIKLLRAGKTHKAHAEHVPPFVHCTLYWVWRNTVAQVGAKHRPLCPTDWAGVSPRASISYTVRMYNPMCITITGFPRSKIARGVVLQLESCYQMRLRRVFSRFVLVMFLL